MQQRMVEVSARHFSPSQIYDSGQCFRMRQLSEDRYQVIAGGKLLELKQQEDTVILFCDRQEYDEVWKHYFDLDTDYGVFLGKVGVRDKYLAEAVRFGSGVRILNQDLWEMIISFIISQQNNIKRIRKCIETICSKYGEDRQGFFDFPTPESLASASEEELRECGLGYRSPYLVKTARMVAENPAWLEQMKTMRYAKAKAELLKLPGVGVKVADCVCLFGLHQLTAFPIDTHIRQVLDRQYPKGFPMRRYAGCQGVIQQYIFYYDLMGMGAGRSK